MDLCCFGSRQGWMDLNAPSESGGFLCFEQRYFFKKQRKKQAKKRRKKTISKPVGTKMQGCPLTDVIEIFLLSLERDTRPGLAFYREGRDVWRVANLAFLFVLADWKSQRAICGGGQAKGKCRPGVERSGTNGATLAVGCNPASE